MDKGQNMNPQAVIKHYAAANGQTMVINGDTTHLQIGEGRMISARIDDPELSNSQQKIIVEYVNFNTRTAITEVIDSDYELFQWLEDTQIS